MAIYYFKKSNQFLEFPENSLSNLYPSDNWSFRLLEQEHLDRLYDNIQSQKTYDYVFNGILIVKTDEQIRNEKLFQLQENYTIKQIQGSVVMGMHFDLTDETKGQVADWNQIIVKDRSKFEKDPIEYVRIFTTASMTDVSGSQQLITDDVWDDFFMLYGVDYATLKMNLKSKERTLAIISGSTLENYDVSL